MNKDIIIPESLAAPAPSHKPISTCSREIMEQLEEIKKKYKKEGKEIVLALGIADENGQVNTQTTHLGGQSATFIVFAATAWLELIKKIIFK